MTGRVKFWDAERGFGFIHRVDTGKEIFFHRAGVEDSLPLRSGEWVDFKVSRETRGPVAINIVRKPA